MGINQLGEWNGPAAAELVAVLTLDEASNILSADDAALTLFGWEASALLGQNLKMLLKDDLGADPRALIEQAQPEGSGSPGPPSLRVVARRKNGTEFAASISILRWCSDTTLMLKGDTAPAPWTALFRNIAAAQAGGSVVPSQANGDSVIESGEQLRQLAQEQEKLKAQIAALETELSQARQEREEERAARSQLENKVYDLTADREDLARQLAEQGEH